jgi:DNA-binding beta-propeller fold protein YncE
VYIGSGDFGGGRVVEYTVGGNTVLRTITDQALGGGTPYGFALDANNNLYVATGENAVYEFAPGATTGTNLGLIGVSGSRGVALDRKNNVFVSGFEIGGGNSVSGYLAGQVTVDRTFSVGEQPFEIAFGKKYKRLYVAQVGFQYDGSVQAYDTKTTDLILTISNGLEQPAGVALSPDVK